MPASVRSLSRQRPPAPATTSPTGSTVSRVSRRILALASDPDGDGIDSGVETFFGTDPGDGNAGLTQVAKSGISVTFQHPEGAHRSTT